MRQPTGWINVFTGVYGSGEYHYSPLYKTREDAKRSPYPFYWKLIYRIHIVRRK